MKKISVLALAAVLAAGGPAFAAGNDTGNANGSGTMHRLGADLKSALHKVGSATRSVLHRADNAVHRGARRDNAGNT